MDEWDVLYIESACTYHQREDANIPKTESGPIDLDIFLSENRMYQLQCLNQ